MSDTKELMGRVRSRILSKLPSNIHELVTFEFKRVENELTMVDDIKACTGCALHESCTQKVPGAGPFPADIMFIGEAPGRNEDEQGAPFVGDAGKLLDNIISAAGWNRNDIYITNIVKCRPPQNRNPLQGEVAACYGHLRKEIETVNPKVIICWGSVSANTLIHPEFRITQENGHWFENDGIRYIALYHPSYLLRLGEKTAAQKKAKREVWEGIKKVLAYQASDYQDELS